MKNLAKRMVAISAALILLCIVAVAQNEKEAKSADDPNYAVVVSPREVNLTPGQEQGVMVIPMMGYYHPTIHYNGSTYEIDQPFSGNIFTVEEPETPGGPYSFIIKAKKNVNVERIESIYINVEEEFIDSQNRNMSRTSGVSVIIKVTPLIQ